MTHQSSTAVGRVVVCGLHEQGLRVVEQLVAAGVDVAVIDAAPDERLLDDLDRLGVELIQADAASVSVLRAAGWASATALICVESDDVQALAIALAAREERPDAPIVVQLRNAALGRALTEIGVRVLDVAALAAPSVVEAVLRAERTRLTVGAVELGIVETVVTRPGSLRELFGDLAPLGVVPLGTSEPVIAPGRDLAVEPGDLVVLTGTDAELSAASLVDRRSRRPEQVFVSARGPRVARIRRRSFVTHFLAMLDRRVKIAIGALLVLASLSVIMLLVGYQESSGRRMSPLDAVYFTVETIGTVGYGDFYFRDQPGWLRLWAICLMVVGATLATVFFALLTNALVSSRLEAALGSRRITGLDKHVVVVGAGSFGLAVARMVEERGTSAVVIEGDPGNRFRGALRALKIPTVLADATLAESWQQVQLGRVRGVVVGTSDDLINLETALAVRELLGERWASVPVVVRMFDVRLARTVESTFGFRNVQSPAALAAPWFVGAALGIEVVDTFYVGDEPLLVVRLPIRAGGGLDERPMAELGARVRVLSLERADGVVEVPPRRATRFRAGDVASVVGPYPELLALLRADRALVVRGDER